FSSIMRGQLWLGLLHCRPAHFESKASLTPLARFMAYERVGLTLPGSRSLLWEYPIPRGHSPSISRSMGPLAAGLAAVRAKPVREPALSVFAYTRMEDLSAPYLQPSRPEVAIPYFLPRHPTPSLVSMSL